MFYGSPLTADWWFMYDDGYGGGNYDGWWPGLLGAGGHRHNILALQHTNAVLVGGGGCTPAGAYGNCELLLA